MNLFYAMGGGMGHLYRTWIFIQQFQITDFKIVTANPLAKQFFVDDQIFLLDPHHYKASWSHFEKIILKQKISALYVDTFPVGIEGELALLLKSTRAYYLARRMRWPQYQHLAENVKVKFVKVYRLETLEPPHEAFIQQQANEIIPLQLNYPAASPAHIPLEYIPAARPLWLVVHAFDADETEQLLRYAREVASVTSKKPFFVILSDQKIRIADGICLSYFPAVDWFPLAEKIFVAGGFNTVQQALPYLDKVIFMPFPRKFDDQAWRVHAFSVQELMP